MYTKLDLYEKAILTITKEQEKIVGKTLSIQMTALVDNLLVKNNRVEIKGDPKIVLKDLVDQYASLFGKASIEVSKEAIKKLGHELESSDIPENLK
ncbi:hypothetical protein CO058_02730 [candidate division WWE3 bacterium CG_4_9_14_0_2_um_filter_35_11]|uniref:Uncharacterized protein n=1 Tax=candidate division WWE3 bacterium CG_4_9_14_0_2_um_filter_35_11 TaxID=1975077 RepID=A0A2M8ELH4_UNCKA|nr:MAG: hypothetical protein COV25_00300 [candidate division WWE3 bacterium CG10_big_fil_rev_8_21_14_0_10_35_32]PJC23578.1 MAG: hypothetical protein CO058_02730 [candidate division WWE3 bacterium CG_4_9_14_0_2_um_filter_35_11]